MKTLALALAHVALSDARTTWTDLHAVDYKYSLEELENEFDLKIPAGERQKREAILKKNLIRMKLHNSKDSW